MSRLINSCFVPCFEYYVKSFTTLSIKTLIVEIKKKCQLKTLPLFLTYKKLFHGYLFNQFAKKNSFFKILFIPSNEVMVVML